MIKKFIYVVFASSFLICCKTIDMEKVGLKADYDQGGLEEVDEPVTEETKIERTDENGVIIGFTEEQKTKIPVIEPPETITLDIKQQHRPSDTGIYEGASALQRNYKDIKVPPKYREGKLVGWLYRDNKIYEVHTQVFRTTMIKLEPGEEMVEVPYISEPDVWRISRGIGYTDGIPTQLIMIKPDYSGLTSTFIVVTNKRIYQIELSSYWDHYMPVCQWVYENDIRDTVAWLEYQEKQKEERKKQEELTAKKVYTSYDYKVTYIKKPLWCPIAVYDDGQKTYIVLDENCLNMELPAIFNKRNEIINYNVDKNKIIINQLIEKCTLKIGNQKVTVEKKKGK